MPDDDWVDWNKLIGALLSLEDVARLCRDGRWTAAAALLHDGDNWHVDEQTLRSTWWPSHMAGKPHGKPRGPNRRRLPAVAARFWPDYRERFAILGASAPKRGRKPPGDGPRRNEQIKKPPFRRRH